jgi:hypothetical protein
MTVIRIESTSQEDVGKKYAGKEIKVVTKKKSSSSKKKSSSSNSSNKNNEVQLSSILGKYEGNVVSTSKSKGGGSRGSITVTPQIQDIKTGNIIQNSQIIEKDNIGNVISTKTIDTRTKKVISNARTPTELSRAFSKAGLGFVNYAYNERQKQLIADRLKVNELIRQDIYNKKLSNIKKTGFIPYIEEKRRKRNKQLSELIKLSPDKSIEKKVINGETLTPKQQERYSKIINENIIKLGKDRFNIAKNLPKDIGLGIWEVGKETLVFGKDVIKGAYNYGYKSSEKANKQGKSVLTVMIKDYGNLVEKVVKGTYKTGKFIKDNPKVSASIVGAVALQLGTNYLKDFLKNPVKTLTKSIAYLYGGKIVGKTPGIKQLRKYLNTEKFSTNTYKVKGNLVTGKLNINGISQGKLKNGKKFISKYELNYNPKSKTFKGNIKTKVGKSEYIQNINLKDEKLYYIDKNTGNKISKIKSPINSRNIKIVEKKIIPTESSILLSGDISVFKGEADIFTTITQISNNLKTTTNKVSKGLKIVDSKNKKTIKNIIKDISIDTKTKRARLPKPLTKEQIEQLESFSKSINYDKILLSGLDKRTRIANALGLRKDNKLLKKFEALIDKNGNIHGYIKRKGNIEAYGILERGKIPNVKIKRKRVSLRKNKKGNLSINDIELVKKDKLKFKKYKSIELPEIKFKLNPTKLNFKKYGIYTSILRLLDKIKSLEKGIIKDNIFDTIKLNKRIKGLEKDIKKINDVIKIKDTESIKVKDTKKIKKPAIKTKTIIKPITEIKKPIKRTIKVPIIKPKIELSIPKIKLFELQFNSKKLENRILRFEGLFRERKNPNKPFSKSNSRTTKKLLIGSKNEVINRVTKLADNKLIASVDLKVLGIGKYKKDIMLDRKTYSKFRAKRSKKSPVLQLVEKRKYRIDTKGEKSEIKSIKKTKKIKSISKTKKCSNIKRKLNLKVSKKVSKTKRVTKRTINRKRR